MQMKKLENGPNHVDLAKWADFMLIAPATANTLAKMANGICDNLLMAVYLSMENQVYIAPAMDLDMYQHPSTKNNLETLKNFGHKIIPATSGELASGLVGEGRMAEPSDIIQQFQKKTFWTGKRVLIGGGPTQEAIDPVRFISNRSSGKMALSLASYLIAQGASVELVHGPVSLDIPQGLKSASAVISADEMYSEMIALSKNADCIIMAAAVADFKVSTIEKDKLKNSSQKKQIDLEPNKDILKELGRLKKEDQFLLGFALETNNERANAIEKLKKKNLDMIVLNSLRNAGAGFESDTNKITILDKDNNEIDFELKTKSEVAKDIINAIENSWVIK